MPVSVQAVGGVQRDRTAPAFAIIRPASPVDVRMGEADIKPNFSSTGICLRIRSTRTDRTAWDTNPAGLTYKAAVRVAPAPVFW